MTKRIYNWVPGPPDPRDYKLSENYKLVPINQLPLDISLETLIPETYDQGNEGSCTCNSTGKSLLYQSRLQNREINPARNQMYFDVRLLEGIDPSDDSGAYIRDVFKCLKNIGAAKEELWPYNDKQYSQKPTSEVYLDAAKTKLVGYHSVNNNALELLNALGQLKKPVVFGMNVYQSFEVGNWDQTTGVMPLPKAKEPVLGGHALLMVGYRTLSNGKRQYKIKNSWGTQWGLNNQGIFWIDEEYIISDNCDDFWVIDSITDLVNPQKNLDWLTIATTLFKSLPELRALKETSLVALGQSLGLPTDMNKTIKANLELVRAKLGL